jgi:hypothetical protein
MVPRDGIEFVIYLVVINTCFYKNIINIGIFIPTKMIVETYPVLLISSFTGIQNNDHSFEHNLKRPTGPPVRAR